MDDEMKARLRKAIREGIMRPHWIKAADRAQLGHNMIAASPDDLTTDVLHEVLALLEPPKESVTWTVGKEVRLAWQERSVMVTQVSDVEQATSAYRRARKEDHDLLILDLKVEAF